MVVVILGMLVCLVLAVVVLALVALPAHRAGEVVFINRVDDEQDETGEAQAAASEHREPANA